jgi:hypothetical protein
MSSDLEYEAIVLALGVPPKYFERDKGFFGDNPLAKVGVVFTKEQRRLIMKINKPKYHLKKKNTKLAKHKI